ncbi:MAG TPA: GNAT family N-acetyltransferase [Anaerolineales bacterium]|nr:GNAT family N-acetyltransferase [Anaerolineales bacterium]
MSVFHIREAKQEDMLAMATVRVQTWRATYKEILPDAFLAKLSYRNVAEHWKKIFWQERQPGVGLFVAENEQDEIIGIAICGPEQNDDLEYRGEIYVLYVLPAYQRQGMGKALVAACVQYLIGELAARTMLIWVIAENPYRKFYESLGGKRVREKKQEIGGKMILEAGYGWDEIDQLLSS